MSKEAKERILLAGDREIKLKCPICGGERFYKHEVRLNTSVLTDFFDKYTFYYACEDCCHMIWMEKDTERYMVGDLSPVGIWEQKFRTWGYADSEDTLRKVLADDVYHEDAHTAALNLLEQLKK